MACAGVSLITQPKAIECSICCYGTRGVGNDWNVLPRAARVCALLVAIFRTEHARFLYAPFRPSVSFLRYQDPEQESVTGVGR